MIREGITKSLPLHTKCHIYILEITIKQDRLILKLAICNQLIKPLALNQLKKPVDSQVAENSLKSHENDPYPWLDEDDPRRDMTDEEILDKYVDLTNSDLAPDEKGTLMKIIKEHKQAFSLRD